MLAKQTSDTGNLSRKHKQTGSSLDTTATSPRCQVTLSRNVAWPVRLVCRSCSVCERHGFPHSEHSSVSTASALSSKLLCPEAHNTERCERLKLFIYA